MYEIYSCKFVLKGSPLQGHILLYFRVHCIKKFENLIVKMDSKPQNESSVIIYQNLTLFFVSWNTNFLTRRSLCNRTYLKGVI